jgi:hypothetical protein
MPGKQKILESLVPFKVSILGAVPGTSRNNRTYSREVLMAATPTFREKPFILDHNYENCNGVVGIWNNTAYEKRKLKNGTEIEGMWLDGVGLMERDLFDKVAGSGPIPPLIKGVSMGADGEGHPSATGGVILDSLVGQEYSLTAFPGIPEAQVASISAIREHYLHGNEVKNKLEEKTKVKEEAKKLEAKYCPQCGEELDKGLCVKCKKRFSMTQAPDDAGEEESKAKESTVTIQIKEAKQSAPPTDQEGEEEESWGDASFPDSSFMYVPDSAKGKDGKKSDRKLPVKTADGKVDIPHVRNALARLNQTQGIPAAAKAEIKKKLQAMLKKDNPDYKPSDEEESAPPNSAVKESKKTEELKGKLADAMTKRNAVMNAMYPPSPKCEKCGQSTGPPPTVDDETRSKLAAEAAALDAEIEAIKGALSQAVTDDTAEAKVPESPDAKSVGTPQNVTQPPTYGGHQTGGTEQPADPSTGQDGKDADDEKNKTATSADAKLPDESESKEKPPRVIETVGSSNDVSLKEAVHAEAEHKAATVEPAQLRTPSVLKETNRLKQLLAEHKGDVKEAYAHYLNEQNIAKPAA